MNYADLINVRDTFPQSLRAHNRSPDQAIEKQIVKELYPALKKARLDGYSFFQIARHLENYFNLPVKAELLSQFYQDINREDLAQLSHQCTERLAEENTLLSAIKEATSVLKAEHASQKSIPAIEVESNPQNFNPLTTTTPKTAGRPEGEPRFRCKPLRPGISPLRQKLTVPHCVYEEGMLEHPAIPGLHLNLEERVYGSYLEIEDIESGETRFEELKEKSLRTVWRKKGVTTIGSTSGDFTEMDLSLFTPEHR